MKKNILACFMLGFSSVCAMELSQELKKDLSEVKIISQSSPIKIEKGFGQNFDYSYFLKEKDIPESNVSDSAYKRRLTYFKNFLFDYVNGYTKLNSETDAVEKSGSITGFLKDYANSTTTLKEKAKSIPYLLGNPVTNFLPELAIKDSPPIKVPIQSKPVIASAPYSVIEPIIFHPHTPHLTKRSDGIVEFRPVITRQQGQYYEFHPLTIKKFDGQLFIFAPCVRRENKQIQILSRMPCYVVRDPDAESLCFTLAKLGFSNDDASVAQREQVMQNLMGKGVSGESKRILDVLRYDVALRKINALAKQEKQKSKSSPKENDKKSFDNVLKHCPHILSLRSLHQRLLEGTNESPDMILKIEQILLDGGYHYAEALDSLLPEYAALYQRIDNDLKNLKNQKSVETQEEKQKEKVESNEASQPIVNIIEKNIIDLTGPVIVKHVPQEIKYAKRVHRWFKDNFIKNKKNSSIFYHTVLPILADPIVIQYGEKSEYDNKTHIGQKDSHYTIAGKITNDETGEESYCIFNLCLDPKGICYHRDCKKCSWEELPTILRDGIKVEDVDYEEGSEKYEQAAEEKPAILQESNISATIYNPAHKCKIILFK